MYNQLIPEQRSQIFALLQGKTEKKVIASIVDSTCGFILQKAAILLVKICKCEILSLTLRHQNTRRMESTEIIKNAGLKITPQRKVVYEVMMELRHAAIDEIIKCVQSKDNEIIISTIYRILDSFCKANLLSRVFHPEVGKSYYDITVTEHHHIFEGESILDYMDEGLTELIRQYLKEKNFASVDISRIQVQITINNPKLNSKK